MQTLNRNYNHIKKIKFVLTCGISLLLLNSTTLTEPVVTATSNSLNFKEHNYPKPLNASIFYLKRDFVAFKEAIAFKESQGKYTTVNTLGYLGKYQFGKTTLERFKITNTNHFLNSPELQEKAFIALCKVNKWILRKDIKRFSGKHINGIKITESGILAAAHLSGAGNVKKFLRSYGKTTFSDAYGASLTYYLKRFSNYNLTNITANKKPKV